MTDGGARRRGRGHGQRLLYWFRTPPGVRVGRAALDEQAMRLLEQHNPDVAFDWPRLLREVPQDPGIRRDRDRDPRDRDRRERRDGRDPRSAPRGRPLDTTAAAVPPAAPPIVHAASAELADERAAAHAEIVLGEAIDHLEPVGRVEALDPGDTFEPLGPVEPVEPVPESLALAHGEPLAADHSEYVEYAAAAECAEPREAGETQESTPAAARLGVEGLTRLRARYAQLVARVAAKPMEEDARAELNARIERLNPDAWLTADEVEAALEQYETVYESLRADVGHPPRRQRRL